MLRGNWTDKIDGDDYILAEDINSIANAVIDLEDNSGSESKSFETATVTWYSAPTTLQKQDIVDLFNRLSSMETGTFQLFLEDNSTILPCVSFSNGLAVFVNYTSEIPMRYEIYAPSLKRYYQESANLVEVGTFDEDSYFPPSMMLVSEYVKSAIEQLKTELQS